MNKIFPLLILLILLLPVVWSLLRPGFFVSDDGEWMVIRFSAFHQALGDGQFPVRWLGRLNYGYGYPVANFLYPGFMYLAEIPKLLGFGFVDSIKIILGISLAGSAIFTFLWLKQIFTPLSALLGAVFYLYAPYHLFDVYKRGSVGEVLALAVVPFILWMIEKKNLFLSSLGIGLLILSHNILAVLFLPIIVCYALLRADKLVTVYYYISTVILGLGMAAFFWIPAIFDLQYTKFFQTQVSHWQEFFANISLLGWGSIIVLLTSVILLFYYNDTYYRSKIFLFFLVIGFGSVFFALPMSKFIWQFIPANFIQFPFRLLSLTILSMAFLAAFVLDRLKGKQKWLIVLIFLLVIIVSAVPYAYPTDFFDKGEGFYATNEATTTVANEYLPIWVREPPLARAKEKVEIVSGKGEINSTRRAFPGVINNVFANSRKVSFEIEGETELEVKINTVYFPGWEVKIDNASAQFSFDNPQGIIILSIPSGKHRVEAIWRETPLRKFSNIISLVTLSILIVFQIMKIIRGRARFSSNLALRKR